MAQDRFIKWKKGRPTKDEVRKVAQNLLGGVGEVGEWDGDFLLISLPGTNTHPLKGIKGTLAFVNLEPGPSTFPAERWIEVWHGDGSSPTETDVLTRHADEFTGGVATQLFDVLARWWGGERDEDHKSRDELAREVAKLKVEVDAEKRRTDGLEGALFRVRALVLGSDPGRCDEVVKLVDGALERPA